MAPAVTYFLGLFGILQAITATPVSVCQLQWGGATVDGHLGSGNVCRYNIKYGQAERWGESSAVATPTDGTGMPSACVQPAGIFDENSQSEDCLNMVVYVPQGADANTPIFTWVHGGSNSIGGAAQAGIDGSALAAKGQVVVVPQYRLGLFGFLPPASSPAAADPNLAVRDVVLALKGIRDNIGSSGNKNAITVGGQSTGATLIRALWAAPSASGLFHRMILQSDPAAFSLSTTAQYESVRNQVYDYEGLKGKSLFELKQLPASIFVGAIWQLQGQYALPYASNTLNPVFGTSTIPKEPTKALTSSPSQLAIKPAEVPLLVTSMRDEGALAVGSFYGVDVDEPAGSPWSGMRYTQGLQNVRCGGGVGPGIIGYRPEYSYASFKGTDRTRAALSLVATDALWRCPARTVASAWASNGGTVHVAEFNAAAPTYLYSQNVPYCSGKVCHGDDIPVVFGNDNSLGDEIINHWTTFIQGNNLSWSTYSANAGQSNSSVKAIGGGSVPNCPTNFWGNQCKFLSLKCAVPGLNGGCRGRCESTQ